MSEGDQFSRELSLACRLLCYYLSIKKNFTSNGMQRLCSLGFDVCTSARTLAETCVSSWWRTD